MFVILCYSDVLHRTIAALVGCALSLGLLGLVKEAPTIDAVSSWIDAGTLLLIFALMIIAQVNHHFAVVFMYSFRYHLFYKSVTLNWGINISVSPSSETQNQRI